MAERFVTPVPIRDSTFGKYYDLQHAFEGQYESIIVATNSYGLRPCGILLPHQLYLDTADKLIEAKESLEGVWVIPVRDKWMRVV